MGEITFAPHYVGRTLEDLIVDLPDGIQVTLVRKGDQNIVPAADLTLASGDGVLIVADREEAIAEAAAKIGRLEAGRIIKDRSALDYIRVFVGKAGLVGIPLARLPMPAGFPAHLLHVRRYDMDVVPTPDLTLEFGDRVGVLMPPNRKEDIRKHFGDTVKATSEFSYVSLGLGMVLGILSGIRSIRASVLSRRHVGALCCRARSGTIALTGPCSVMPLQPILCCGATGGRYSWPPSASMQSAVCPHRVRNRVYNALHRDGSC